MATMKTETTGEQLVVTQPDTDETDDFFSGLVEPRDSTKFGDDEIIDFSPPAYDPAKRIAMILDSQNNENNHNEQHERNEDPMKLMVLNRLAGKIPANFIRSALGLNLDSPEFAGVISSARTAQDISILGDVNNSKGAMDYLNRLGAVFGDRLTKLFEIELTDDLERKIDTETKFDTPQYKTDFFDVASPGSLATARLLLNGINGFEERVCHISSPDDLARLITINHATNLVGGEEGTELKKQALKPDSDLKELATKAFILIARNNGTLNGFSSEEAFQRYQRVLSSRKPFAAYLTQQFQDLGKFKTDFASLEEKARQELFEGKNIVIRDNPYNNGEGYEWFKRELNGGQIYEPIELTERIDNDKEYKRLQKKLEDKRAERDKVLGAETLRDLRDRYNGEADYWREVSDLLQKRLGIEIESEEIYHVTRNPDKSQATLTDIVKKKVKEKLKSGVNHPTLRSGDVLKVVKMNGGFEDSGYYYGGDETDVKLNSEGELVGIVNDDTLTLEFNDGKSRKRFNFHKNEVEYTGKNIKTEALNKFGNNPEEISKAAVNEAEIELLPKHLKRAKQYAKETLDESVGDAEAELESRIDGWYNSQLTHGTEVRIARALGDKEGFYKSGRSMVARHAIGTIGVVDRHEKDGFFRIYLRKDDGYLNLHYNELQKLVKILATKRTELKPEFDHILEYTEREHREHENRLREVVTQAIDNFALMNVNPGIVRLFLTQYVKGKFIPDDKLPQKNPFEELVKLQDKMDYAGYVRNVNQLIRDKLGIIVATNINGRNGDETDFDKFNKALLDRVILGYKPVDGKVDPEKLKRGDIVVTTREFAGVPAGVAGFFIDTCGNAVNGIHVNYRISGRADERICTKAAVHGLVEKAYEFDQVPLGKFVKGARVKIREDSEFFGQQKGFGILTEDLEGQPADQYKEVNWAGGYHNGYRKKDLELGDPEKNLDGEDLIKYRENKQRLEEFRKGLEVQVNAVIAEAQKEREGVLAQLYDVSRRIVNDFASLGFESRKIRSYFDNDTNVSRELKTEGII